VGKQFLADIPLYQFPLQLVEFSRTKELFTRPKQELTDAYLTGRMG